MLTVPAAESVLVIELAYFRVNDVLKKSSSAKYTKQTKYPIRLLFEPIIKNILMELDKNLDSVYEYIKLKIDCDIDNNVEIVCSTNISSAIVTGVFKDGKVHVKDNYCDFSSEKLAKVFIRELLKYKETYYAWTMNKYIL